MRSRRRLNIFFNQERKSLYTILSVLLVSVLTLTVVYAALSTTLKITGTAEVSAANWDIYLDNIQLNSNSATTNVPTITDKTTASFSTTLSKPGDFYEFAIDVVNNGSIDAMIDSVTKTPTLSTTQAKYLNYIVEYQNGESINTKQLVSKNSFVRLKVKVEFRKDLSSSDLPTQSETLNLSFKVNYIQSDSSGSSVTDNGVYDPIRIVSGNYDTVGSEICIGEECFYVISSTTDTVTMLSKYNLYVGSKYENYTTTAYGSEATGIQDANMLGQGESYDDPIHGVIAYSSDNYWHSGGIKSDYGTGYPAYVYDSNSYLYNHVENYKTYLNNQGVNILEARLIKKEELETLGCNISSKTCSGAPSFVYTTSYWTGTAYDSLGIVHVQSSAYYTFYNYYAATSYGVRPVITISK